MTSDMRLGMAQSFRTSRSSFTSNNGYESPSLNPASVSNGKEYDSDGSNFAPPTPSTLSMAVPPVFAGAIRLIDKFQVTRYAYALNCNIHTENFFSVQFGGGVSKDNAKTNSISWKTWFFSSRRSTGTEVREKFTFADMMCFQKMEICAREMEIPCHEHTLRLVDDVEKRGDDDDDDDDDDDEDTVCDGCNQSITGGSAYDCTLFDFFLDKWCAGLPRVAATHPPPTTPTHPFRQSTLSP